MTPSEIKALLPILPFPLRFSEINTFFSLKMNLYCVFYRFDSDLNSLHLILNTVETFS